MLGILLMILKIIGIILLIVLAIVIAVLGILLFVPVRYRFYGCFRENCRVAEGKITWLKHIVSCPFFLTGENPGIQFRIFGKKVDLEKRKQGRKKQKKQKNRTKYKTAKTSAPEAKERLKSTISSQHKETLQIQEISGPPQNTEELQEKTGKLPGKSIFEKISDTIQNRIRKIKKRILRIRNAIKRAIQKKEKISKLIESLKSKKEKIFDFLADEEAQRAKGEVILTCKKLFRHIMPVKLRADVKFGFSEPDETGVCYALLCLLYGKYEGKLILEPDFEHELLEGEIRCKGRIRLINLIYYGISFYRNKKLKEFITLIQNL